jgi:hypothetical protein
MTVINQYSFLIFALLCLGALVIFLARRGIGRSELLTIGALLIGLVAAYLFFTPTAPAGPDTQQIERQVGQGSPVLIEFQSPY